MVGQLPFQGFLQLRNLPAQLAQRQLRELVGVGLPFHQPLNHGPAGNAHHNRWRPRPTRYWHLLGLFESD